MSIFAIGDLHLSLGTDKPMDVFGPLWDRHWEKLETNWRQVVGPEDLVLLAGDHSWGLKPREALPDLEFIGSLPGKKLLIRGNHDLWWQSRKKTEAMLPESMYILQNDSFAFEDWRICGSRGWLVPGDDAFGAEDGKIYRRELIRLEMSLKAAGPGGNLLAMMHFPPVGRRGTPTEFSRMLSAYGVKTCVYGHIHGPGLSQVFEGELEGVRYQLVSADFLGFMPKRITPGDFGCAISHNPI